MTLESVTTRMARNLYAALDPRIPTDHTIKQWIYDHFDKVPYSSKPPADYPDGWVTVTGLPHFKFPTCDAEGNATHIFVTPDAARGQALIARGWMESAEYAVVPFADILANRLPETDGPAPAASVVPELRAPADTAANFARAQGTPTTGRSVLSVRLDPANR